jgi:hypothetical protein
MSSIPMGEPAPSVVLLDSITQVTPDHAGMVVVTGSHGGVSAAHYARAVAARLYVFNDAGVGKDEAGIAALTSLDAHGLPAATVSHLSARIGEARDTWDCGVISNVNARARRLGLRQGIALKLAVAALTVAD